MEVNKVCFSKDVQGESSKRDCTKLSNKKIKKRNKRMDGNFFK